MKMDYKHDFLAALVEAKEQGIGALLAFFMAVLRGKYQGSLFWKTVIDALMCAMIAWFIRDILDFIGLRHDLGYVASVFIGYVGTDFIGMGIKRLVGERFGGSDANQR